MNGRSLVQQPPPSPGAAAESPVGPAPSSPERPRRIAVTAAALRHELVGIALPLGFYLLYTVLGLAGGGQAGDARWAGRFMASMAALGAMSAALAAGPIADTLVPRTNSGRGVPSGVVRWLAVALGGVGPPLIVVSGAGALLNGVRLAPTSWLGLIAWLWIGAIPFLVLGLLLRRLVPPDAAGVVMLGLAIALGVLGGLFQPAASLPSLLRGIATWLPSSHLASLGWSATAGRGPVPVDIAVLAAYTVGLLAVLRWTGGDERRRADG